MTVSELIEELQKFQPHYIVLLATPTTDIEAICPHDDLHFVGDVQQASNVGDLGCVVKIFAEE